MNKSFFESARAGYLLYVTRFRDRSSFFFITRLSPISFLIKVVVTMIESII